MARRLRQVLVVGSGALARAVGYALAVRSPGDTALTVLARSHAAAKEVCGVAAMRAASAGRFVPVRAHALDLDDDRTLKDLLHAIEPAVVVNCASHQSPSEVARRPSAWAAAVRDGGIGMTIALQAGLVTRVARTLAEVAPAALLLNGSYPDLVNPVLRAQGLPVLCGVGNVAVLHAAVRATLPGDEPTRVLGHHVHLYRPADDADEAMVWHGAHRLPDVAVRLAPVRSATRAELNHVTGQATAELVSALLDGEPWATSLPGPYGLPGGYPVRLSDGLLRLDLPPGLSIDEAVDVNRRMSRLEGVDVDEQGVVSFTGRARRTLEAVAPELAGGFHAAWELDRAVCRFRRLQDELRARPDPRAPADRS